MSKKLRIGGASGFWGDSAVATPQLLNGNNLDFIVYDYLAEITMSIMARARTKDPSKGYAIDFVSSVMKLNLRQIADQKVKILSNAGGVNPQACAEAIRALIKELNLDLKGLLSNMVNICFFLVNQHLIIDTQKQMCIIQQYRTQIWI